MEDITMNEMKAVLKIFKDFKTRYNSNNLSKELELTSMGTLKILRRLYEKNILKLEELGKAKYYSINFDNEFSMDYIKFLLQKEANESLPRIKRWLEEIKKFKDIAQIGVLFGSVLRNDKHEDVDLVLIFNKNNNEKINKQLKELNIINIKQIHPIEQTSKDFKNNIAKKDKVILESIKRGVIAFGYDKYVEVIKNYSR